MNPKDKSTPSRSLDPSVDLRTIPSGWDLSGLFSPADNWVNEPQPYQDRSHINPDSTGIPSDNAADAV
ncbi:MAG TPA: hypothetical protein VIS10_07330 [Anaerolineales bacterium]